MVRPSGVNISITTAGLFDYQRCYATDCCQIELLCGNDENNSIAGLRDDPAVMNKTTTGVITNDFSKYYSQRPSKPAVKGGLEAAVLNIL